MTNNLGDVRHAMASQPSLYSEERKLLRIQAWEQRNQEICQEQTGHAENVPLFGKPYKTSKWDELSCRIQKMLGSYEDGKDPDLNSGNFVKDLLGSSSNHASIMATLNQRQLTPAHASTKPSFHGGPRPASTSTPAETLARTPHGAEAAAGAAPRPSPGYLQEVARARPRSPGQRDDEEDLLDMEYARLPAMLATLSPLAEMESPLHSSDGDPFGRPRDADRQGAFDLGAESPQRSLVSPIRPMETPEPKPPTKGGPAAPQAFPPPLASKAAGVVVTKKPTAYVRPMDGQDQVIMGSPELKPSPEPYEPLSDKKNNHHHHHPHHHHNNINNNNNAATLSKSLPRTLEPRPNDAQCVEDILREMTHSWPPLLTTIQTPSASQTPRSPPAAKVVERVQIKHPGKEHYDSPPTESPVSSQQSSACTVEAAHSSGVESASSSDSESSSASESENDSARRRPPQPPRGSSPAEVKTPAPHGDWQLANWIRSGQQNTGGASQTPPHKAPPPPQPSQRSSGPRDAATAAAASQPPRDYKPHVSSDQEGSSHSQVAKTPQCRVPLKHSAPARAKASDDAAAATAGGRVKPACKKHSAKPGRTLSPKPPKAAPQAETTRAGPAEDKGSSPCPPLTFTYRPKVKTKTKRSSGGGPKAERASLPRQEDTSTCVPNAPLSAPPCHCGRSPDRCVCPAAPSPGGPDRALAAPSAESSGGCAGVKKEPAKRPQGAKKAPKTVKPEAVQPPPGKPATAARSLVPSLLVKIDLSLLCRVPFVSAVAQETTTTTTTTSSSTSSSSSNSTTTIPTNSATNNSTTTTGTSSTSSSSNSRGKGASETGGKGGDPSKWGPTKNKRGPAESDKNPPKKRQKMEKKAKVVEQLPGRATVKSESSVIVVKEEKRKTAKKRGGPQSQQQHCSGPKDHGTDARHGKDGNPKHKSTKKHKEHAKTGKKGPKSMLSVQASAEPSRGGSSTRPMLRFEDRLYPVKHYIKEAKKLKHKADAESDKVSKAFGYLEAAMFFAESGVAMETELETSKSPYSMYEDTVELIKFTLKQKNSGDSSALPSENDFTVLCLKCQSFLQMAMFRCKQKVASKYSKTLKTHFMNCKPSLDASLGSSSADAASPRSFAASPALAAPGSTTSSSSSGPGSNHSCGGGEGPAAAAGSATSNTVSIPKIIHHVAFSYVNITALFVSAHDLWEKAEALTHKSSGVLSELNAHMEPLSLSSSVKAMVQYTRQALNWLRLDAQSLK
ncbi:AF4/FMR2 family member 1 isoform X2 [Gadus morhua]|uniref:AF4/FMR2 family member 1 isoform X2 n=1 Tax=Gadus morhua TaxID=8049 RepID=UPI0011B65BCA|nr:AF4/FMR2 family member 1-like isoform X2 [Gadus morhua]